jgi:hypothetical protein
MIGANWGAIGGATPKYMAMLKTKDGREAMKRKLKG